MFLTVTVLVVLFALCVGVGATEASEPTILGEGYVEDGCNLYWTFDSEGTLTISHKPTTEGETLSTLLDLDLASGTYATKVPWTAHRSSIAKIVLDVDTSISIIDDHFFRGLKNLTTVVTPDVTLYIRCPSIFKDCTNLVTFGPEGTPTGTFDLRNVVGAGQLGDVAVGSDVADAVWYFAIHARNTTGAELVVDGGNTIQLYPVIPKT
ncbi:MAG: hypothetical protein IKJ91_11490 [Clostridia bacterium]|nr:hypothetical protein [Clostridia bacterium]